MEKKTREFYFKGISKIVMQHTEGEAKSSLLRTDFGLEVSPMLADEKYVQPGSTIPNGPDGSKVLTQTFVQGLAGNILASHAAGFWDKEGHLAYIKAELERALGTDFQITGGNF